MPTIDTVNAKLLAVALWVIVFIVALRRPRGDADRQLAKELLGSQSVQQLVLSDDAAPPAYRAGSRAALFFERMGMQGMIRGVILVEDDHVVDLRILQSREGLAGDTLDSPDFLVSFRDRPAKPPITVDAVSGATISSQAVTDAVNGRLSQWARFAEQETRPESGK